MVRWGVHDVPLGRVLIGVTGRGICWLAFIDDADAPVIAEFEHEWRGARLLRDDAATAGAARQAFDLAARHRPGRDPLPLLLRGTNFQVKVWEALLRIPFGRLVSYQAIARAIGQPTAVRAVGRAVGANNISWLIPCHRVILSTGIIHNYRWGVRQKQVLVGFEAALAQASALTRVLASVARVPSLQVSMCIRTVLAWSSRYSAAPRSCPRSTHGCSSRHL